MSGNPVSLVDRVRILLGAQPSIREVAMFGGRAFMVNDAMVVSAGRDGSLLVRVDPTRHDEFVQLPGACQATMGKDRDMGPSWITVASDALVADDDLRGWIDRALDYNSSQTVVRRGGRSAQ